MDMSCVRGLQAAGAKADTSCVLRTDIRFWAYFCTHHEYRSCYLTSDTIEHQATKQEKHVLLRRKHFGLMFTTK